MDFDTENKKINLIDMDSRAKYRGLNINYSNFLQSINRKRSVDEMTTRLYVYGSEDLSIENVNPTGMATIVPKSSGTKKGWPSRPTAVSGSVNEGPPGK